LDESAAGKAYSMEVEFERQVTGEAGVSDIRPSETGVWRGEDFSI